MAITIIITTFMEIMGRGGKKKGETKIREDIINLITKIMDRVIRRATILKNNQLAASLAASLAALVVV